MIVMKFGGTSVGDASAFRQTASIVVRHLGRQPVVVVSAMSGVTNRLLALAAQSESGDATGASLAAGELIAQHLAIAEDVLVPSQVRSTQAILTGYGDGLRSILAGVGLVRELTPRTRDAVAAFGEKMSSALLAALLTSQGCPARSVSAEDLIITDDNHGQAVPILSESNRRISRRVQGLQARGLTPVITGFIARSKSGATTTLSRGGSDYSASLIGAALHAEEIWIWTDVDGVMTADPRCVSQARTLPSLTYAEAAELSYFGAKVLHPRTVAPAVGKGIPVWIKNTFHPDAPGTLITGEPGDGAAGPVKAITSMAGMSLVTVEGSGMIGVPGIAARVFAAVASLGTSVLMISQSSSEYNICFVVSHDQSAKVLSKLRSDFSRELREGDVSAIRAQDAAVLAVVGEGMHGTPGVAGRLFVALGRAAINVIAIAQGSSELNISLVVEDAQRVAALQAIHAEFIA